jgi:hypothetical protein
MKLFTVRQKQIEAFEEDRLLTSMYEAMFASWPDECSALGRSGVQDRIRAGIVKAKEYAIREQENVRRFIHLIFLLNREDFDTAPETEWAGKMLRWPDADEFLRLAALEKRAQIEMTKKYLNPETPEA